MKKKKFSVIVMVIGIIIMLSYSCSKDDDDTKIVTGITLNTNYLSLEKNAEATFSYTLTPSDATEKTITWSSDHESIAKVDSDGKVTGIGLGVTTIHATAQSGVTAKCDVGVYDGTETQRIKWEGITKGLTLTFSILPSSVLVVIYNDADEFIKTINYSGNPIDVPAKGSLCSTKPLIANLALIENNELTHLDCSNNSIENLAFHNSVASLKCDNCPDLKIVNIDGANEISDVNENVLNTLKDIPDITVEVNGKYYGYQDGEWVEKQQP